MVINSTCQKSNSKAIGKTFLREHLRLLGVCIVAMIGLAVWGCVHTLLFVGAQSQSQAGSNWLESSKIKLASFQEDADLAQLTLQEKVERLDAMSDEDLRKEYEAQIQLWRDNFAKLAHAQTAYYNRPESESAKWAKQFRNAQRDGEEARRSAGLAAVVLAERKGIDQDPDLAVMVFRSMEEYLLFEKYHMANRAGKVLAESEARNGPALSYAGFAAYSNNNFEEARMYFSEAVVSGYDLPSEYVHFNEILDEAISTQKAEEKRQSNSGDNPIATIETTKGTIVCELFEDQAPNTVANFITLAESHFYDGLEFFDSDVSYISTGSPTNQSDGNAGYQIGTEAERDDSPARLRGSLMLMVVPELGVGSSQFSILTQPTVDSTNSKNTVFGRVIEGDIVLDDINRLGEKWQELAKNTNQILPKADRIKTITISKKRDHEYKVKKFGQK